MESSLVKLFNAAMYVAIMIYIHNKLWSFIFTVVSKWHEDWPTHEDYFAVLSSYRYS